VIVDECSRYAGQNSSEVFVVDVPEGCEVTVLGSGGRDIYTIKPSAKSIVTIEHFNLTSNVIDLSLHRSLRKWSDIVMTRGSVKIHLPTDQLVVLTGCDPSDMTPKHFILNSSKDDSELFTTYAIAAMSIIGVISFCLLCAIMPNIDDVIDTLELDRFFPVKKDPVLPVEYRDRSPRIGGEASREMLSVVPQPALLPIDELVEEKSEGLNSISDDISSFISSSVDDSSSSSDLLSSSSSVSSEDPYEMSLSDIDSDDDDIDDDTVDDV